MAEQASRIEVIWGHKLLDEGFTAIPNILIRNYRKLNINHGEWGFICTLLTYKHSDQSPYPSQETLAEHLEVSTRQIKKWVETLVEKNLLRVGQRRNTKSKQYGNAVYDFKPLMNAALRLCDEEPLPESNNDWDIEYRDPSVPEVHTEPSEPEVPTDGVPEVHTDGVPEVHPKRSIKKTSIKKINNNKEMNPVVVEFGLDLGFDEVTTTVESASASKEDIQFINAIETQLGTRIETLYPLLAEWVQTYGKENLIGKARLVSSRTWNNIIGAYRSAVEMQWVTVPTQAEEPQKDERYTNFYQLFPEG